MKHDYEKTLKALEKPKTINPDDPIEAYGIIIYNDPNALETITDALKLAAKLEQEPSEGMFLAGDTAFENGYIREMFEAMLDQARKEIE